MVEPKRQDLVKSLSDFFKRDLISIPLIKQYPHQQVTQRCGLKAATLELDTAAFPNIEYIAGNRLSVYPVNPSEHVNAIMKHLIDDLLTPVAWSSRKRSLRSGKSMPEEKPQDVGLDSFVQFHGKEGLRMALTHLYDITTAPSRDLLRLMSGACSNKEQRSKLLAIVKSDDTWEKWICFTLRTLKSTLEEFNSCQLSARSLLTELTVQQPRQYSISSIKSSKRFRTEIVVFQHKFNSRQIASSLQALKEHEKMEGLPKSPAPTTTTSVHMTQETSEKSPTSIRSLRSVATFGPSPISTQRVKHVPSYSGPLMSQYASSSLNVPKEASTSGSRLSHASVGGANHKSQLAQASPSQVALQQHNGGSQPKQYYGLCSNYLLNLNSNEQIICEFVENPRFTLKGNRERPIMMIGQDIGVLAYRAFWQQRVLEHDRAQIFYTLFKDLSRKKFGDMQLVCITGNRCKVEDLFRRELNAMVTSKIISAAIYINKAQLVALLDSAASQSGSQTGSQSQTGTNLPQQKSTKLPLAAKELADLGKRIARLLIESNGCLYTCCDAQMTQAIEILAVESVAQHYNMARDKIMALLPKWKGRRITDQVPLNDNTQKFLFTLENPFEKAQIVQEIYDSSI